jgi:CMP-N-acetylneuraminic acid synthetase
MRTLVVIPARGGSRGVPRKNLRPLGGKPLLAWAIGAAKAATKVDRVVVSTDSDEVATIAERFGAEPHRRDPELARDAVTLDPVIHEVVMALDPEGSAFDVVATIQPTSPLLRSTTVDAVLDRLRGSDLDSVLTVVDDTHLTWVDGPDGPTPDFTERLNRQQLARRYRETGGVLATRRSLIRRDSRLGERVGIVAWSWETACRAWGTCAGSRPW